RPPAPRPTPASRPQLPEAGERAGHDRLVSLCLDPGAEQLDVPPAAVARRGESLADAPQRDVTIPHHDALAGSHGSDGEVAHLDDGDPVAALPDVGVESPLAPGRVQLEHDPQPARAEVVDEIEGVRERVQEPEVDAQLADGLDRETYTETLGVRQEFLQERPRTRCRFLPG